MNTEENKELINNEEGKTKKEDKPKKREQKLKLASREYTDEELTNVIRNKYRNHDQYFKVLKVIVDKICEAELKEINNAMKELEQLVCSKGDLPMNKLEKYVIQIPIYMYKLNSKLAAQGLNMEISNHLNSYEITEELMKLQGGSATERMKVAEYNSMTSTFTLLIKNRVYYNIKNSLDYSTKVYDGLKKALSAQIEELKVFGKDVANR